MADYIQYDQNAEGAGFGGFEEEGQQQQQQQQQTGTQQKTQSGPKKVQNTYPANVAQILKSAQSHPDVLKINEREIQIVNVVGKAFTTKMNNDPNSFFLKDPSGSIKCSKQPQTTDASVEPGAWYHVFGAYKSIKGESVLNVWQLKKISDYDEILYHYSEVLRLWCLEKFGPLAVEEQPQQPQQQQQQQQPQQQ